MSEWLPAAVKGRLDVDVFTLQRALADGLVRSPLGTTWTLDGDAVEVLDEDDGRSRGRFAFMVRIFPDETSPYDALFANVNDLRDFLREMTPRNVRLQVAEDESEESLGAALRGELH